MEMIETNIPIKMFNLAPQDERDFYIAIGHVANEFSILTRMTYMALNSLTKREVHSSYEFTQVLFFLKTSCGKLIEANKMINNLYYGTKISIKYNDHISRDVKLGLRSLKKSLSKNDSSIEMVRNKYAFHYGLSGSSLPLENFSGEICQIYLSPHVGASLFYISELSIYMDMCKGPDHHTKLSEIVDETAGHMKSIIALSNDYTEHFLKLHIGDDIANRMSKFIKLDDIPDLNQLKLPAVVDATESFAAHPLSDP